MMTRIRYLTMLMLLLAGSTSLWAQTDFDPSDPPEPGLPPMRLELRVSPAEAGSASGGGTYREGTSVPLRAYANTGFVFDRWTDKDGNTLSTSANYAYTKGEGHEVLTANFRFDPAAPAEPADPATILYYRLSLTQTEGGSVSGGGRYLAGTQVSLSAYTNTGFDFDGWYDKDGNCVSESSHFSYTMPEGATTLEGRFTFNPDSPAEPDEPIVKHSVMATAGEGGYTNFSMRRELTGTGITLSAYANTGYRFDGWYLDGELYTRQSTFSYTIGTENVSFEARFYFDPDSPSEPGMPQVGKYTFTLMNKVSKPGAVVKFPIYLTSLDELHDMTFQLTFPQQLVPSLAEADIEVIPQGKTGSFNIELTNTDTFVAFQMELDLPDGITFVSATKGNRYEESHSLGMSANGQTVKFTLNSATNEAIKGNSGALITISVMADADLDAGTKLTATLKGMEFARKDETFIRPDALDFDIEITDRVILDENSTALPTATDDEVDILVKRTIKANQWNTICLPFDMSEEQLYEAFGEDVELAEIDTDEAYAVNDDGTIEVYFIDSDLTEGLYANWPYIIKTSTDISEFETTAQIVPDEDEAVAEYYTGKGKNKKLKGTFTGTYHAQTMVPKNNLFISGNHFWYSAGKTKMKAFRAYLWFDDVLPDIETASSRISMHFSDGSPTGVREVNMKRSNDDIFDLQGRRIQQPTRGLYISNGRKALVK